MLKLKWKQVWVDALGRERADEQRKRFNLDLKFKLNRKFFWLLANAKCMGGQTSGTKPDFTAFVSLATFCTDYFRLLAFGFL